MTSTATCVESQVIGKHMPWHVCFAAMSGFVEGNRGYAGIVDLTQARAV